MPDRREQLSRLAKEVREGTTKPRDALRTAYLVGGADERSRCLSSVRRHLDATAADRIVSEIISLGVLQGMGLE